MTRREWTGAEIGQLRMLWPTASHAEIVAALPDRSWDAIQRQAKRHGIRRDRAANFKAVSQRAHPLFVELRERREAREWTRPELATRIGIHPVMLARYELGTHHPNWQTFAKWCAALGVVPALKSATAPALATVAKTSEIAAPSTAQLMARRAA